MNNKKKLFAILGILIVLLISSIVLFSFVIGSEKSANNEENKSNNTNEETETVLEEKQNVSEPSEHFGRLLDEKPDIEVIYEETENNDENGKYKIENLTFSEPQLLEGFYEKEWAPYLKGFSQGNTILIFSEGYDETITYEINKDKRKVIEEFTDFQYIDPETERIIYTKLNEERIDGPQTVYEYVKKEGKKNIIAELEPGEFMKNAVIFKGVLFYGVGGEYEDAKTIRYLPIPGEYDKGFYKSIEKNLKNNSFDNLATDGDRLILSSNKEKKVSEFTSGKEKILADHSKEDIFKIKIHSIKGDNYIYTVQNNDDYEVTAISGTYGDKLKKVSKYPLILTLIDEQNTLLLDEEYLALSVYNFETEEIKHLADNTMNFYTSGNRIIYESDGSFYYIDFE